MKKRVAPLQSPKLLDTTPASKLPFGIPPAYWKDQLAHDPVAQAKQYRRPILILQGERDYQVTLADFDGWKKGLGRRKQVTLQSYPRLNHHFIEGQGKSRPEEYDRPGNVAEEVIADVATWITRGKI